MSEQPSWDDLGPQKPPEPKDDRFTALCAEVFTSPAGKALLEEMRRKYFEQGQNPLADERALRVFVSQQHFVRELERARDRGLKAK
jgi:hypothetical protein